MMNLMKNPPKVARKQYQNGTLYWLVTYSIRGEGQFKPKFDTEELANEHKQEMIRKYMGGMSMKDQELARLALEKFGAYQAGDQELAKIDLVQLVDWACQNYQAPTGMVVEDLVDDFLAIKRKQGKRPDTVRELETYLNTFAADFKGRGAETFQQIELERYLNKKYRWNENRFGTIKHFFAWLSGTSKATPNTNPPLRDTPFRGYITGRNEENEDDLKDIVIYSASECEAILRIAGNPEYNCQGMFAFMLFTGCRPMESQRFWDDTQAYGWNLINWEKKKIRIPSKISKNKRTRYVEINDAMLAWLERYRNYPTLLPYNWNAKYTNVRKKALKGEKLVKDVPRHTFITQSHEQGISFDKLAVMCGNSRKIILDHYATLSNKVDSDAFFRLTPDKFECHDLMPDDYIEFVANARNKILSRHSDKVREFWRQRKNEAKG